MIVGDGVGDRGPSPVSPVIPLQGIVRAFGPVAIIVMSPTRAVRKEPCHASLPLRESRPSVGDCAAAATTATGTHAATGQGAPPSSGSGLADASPHLAAAGGYADASTNFSSTVSSAIQADSTKTSKGGSSSPWLVPSRFDAGMGRWRSCAQLDPAVRFIVLKGLHSHDPLHQLSPVHRVFAGAPEPRVPRRIEEPEGELTSWTTLPSEHRPARSFLSSFSFSDGLRRLFGGAPRVRHS